MSRRGTALRQADDADWRQVFGNAGPPPTYWIGLACDGRHTINAMGGIYLTDDGTWWGFFWRAPHANAMPLLTHKGARIIVEAAREAGLVVRVMQDHRFSRSTQWLTRLGFVPTGEKIKDEWQIWTR